jgi:nicotinamide-nucleotide amidase
MMFDEALLAKADALLAACRSRRLMVVTAESCTGGLVAACLTSIAGASDVFERGYVTYSNQAKMEEIGVPQPVLAAHGAVSEETARAMAEGTLRVSQAQIALAVTGIAGPAGGTSEKPVGLVHIAAARKGFPALHRKLLFGPLGRDEIRLRSVAEALDLGLAQATRAEP